VANPFQQQFLLTFLSLQVVVVVAAALGQVGELVAIEQVIHHLAGLQALKHLVVALRLNLH
jgi:hypothetical protein